MRSYHPPRVSLYANKLLHATGERDIERLKLADRNAAPSLVTRSFIAIERTSRNTPPSLCRSDKSRRERTEPEKARHVVETKRNTKAIEGLEATRGPPSTGYGAGERGRVRRAGWATINLLATLR